MQYLYNFRRLLIAGLVLCLYGSSVYGEGHSPLKNSKEASWSYTKYVKGLTDLSTKSDEEVIGSAGSLTVKEAIAILSPEAKEAIAILSPEAEEKIQEISGVNLETSLLSLWQLKDYGASEYRKYCKDCKYIPYSKNKSKRKHCELSLRLKSLALSLAVMVNQKQHLDSQDYGTEAALPQINWQTLIKTLSVMGLGRLIPSVAAEAPNSMIPEDDQELSMLLVSDEAKEIIQTVSDFLKTTIYEDITSTRYELTTTELETLQTITSTLGFKPTDLSETMVNATTTLQGVLAACNQTVLGAFCRMYNQFINSTAILLNQQNLTCRAQKDVYNSYNCSQPNYACGLSSNQCSSPVETASGLEAIVALTIAAGSTALVVGVGYILYLHRCKTTNATNNRSNEQGNTDNL